MRMKLGWLVAGVLGAAIWLLSPVVTGHREPWDAKGPYFLIALLIAGAVMGALQRGRPWRAGMWIYLGQTAAVLVVSRGDIGLFFPMGMIVLAVFTLLSVASAALVGWLCRCGAKKA